MAQAVAEVVAGWTGIPVGRMVGDEIHTVLGLLRARWRASHRPVAGAEGDRPGDPDLARAS